MYSTYRVFIIYSRKVQIKYIADTRLQGRNQEKHMVIWLEVITANDCVISRCYIVGKCKRELNPTLHKGRVGEREGGGLKHILHMLKSRPFPVVLLCAQPWCAPPHYGTTLELEPREGAGQSAENTPLSQPVYGHMEGSSLN
jgi:hypothetical protein